MDSRSEVWPVRNAERVFVEPSPQPAAIRLIFVHLDLEYAGDPRKCGTRNANYYLETAKLLGHQCYPHRMNMIPFSTRETCLAHGAREVLQCNASSASSDPKPVVFKSI